MPIYATKESTDFWQNLQSQSRARSLAATHFVTIAKSQEDKTWRKQSCEAIKAGAVLKKKTDAYKKFNSSLVEQSAVIVFAKLEARMIIDSANGVLENGGICLDRTSGIPFIPGSAIKGAARHYSIYALSQEDDIEKKTNLLYQICLVFGYGKQEWKAGRDKSKNHSHSDFWLAMTALDSREDKQRDEVWGKVADKVAAKLFAKLKQKPKNQDSPLCTQLPNLSGSICFLPAYPEKDPGIDIDVLTCHHPEYYSGKRPIATDDENPNPILFPTIRAGATFRFCLIPTPLTGESDLKNSKQWLSEALTAFGIGAKTNAGYGWFSIDHEAEKARQKEQEIKKEQDKEKDKIDSMTPDDLILYELEQLNDDAFAARVRDLAEQSEDQQKAICQLLAGNCANKWKDWNKPKAKKWKPRIAGIRQIAEQLGVNLP